MRKETTWAYEQEVAFEHEQARLREENNLEEVSETKTRLRKGLKKAVYALIFVAGCFLAYCMELLFSTFLVAASMRSLLPPTFLARFVKMVAGMLRNLNLDVLADTVEKLMVRDALRWYRTGRAANGPPGKIAHRLRPLMNGSRGGRVWAHYASNRRHPPAAPNRRSAARSAPSTICSSTIGECCFLRHHRFSIPSQPEHNGARQPVPTGYPCGL